MIEAKQLGWAVDAETQLRMLKESDTRELFALTMRNRRHLQRWLSWVDQIQSTVHTRRYIRSSNRQFREGGGFQAGIWFRDYLVGIVGFQNVDWTRRSATLGYWLDATYQGRGLVSRACGVLLDWAFREWHLNRVEIRCARENHRSRAIPERLGFTREGVIREGEWLSDQPMDLVIYGMLARDWRRARSQIRLSRLA